MTRDDLGGYIREHRVSNPPPATLPGSHGETVELYEPTPADKAARDWRVA